MPRTGETVNIGTSLSSTFFASWNRSNTSVTMPQGSFEKTMQRVASAWKVKDEYIPSSSLGKTSKTTFSVSAARKSLNATSVNEAMQAAIQSVGLTKEDYFNFALVIDKDGRFQSGGGIINHNAYNWDTKDQEKLGEVIAGLNKATVNGRRLAEVMLEQFAKETGMDLGEERKKDSFFHTCVVYNSGLSETRVNPDDITSMSNSFATIMRQRITTESSFYELADKPKLGSDGLDNNLKALADWQFLGFEFNDLEAPWNRYILTDGSSEDYSPPLSLITEIQQVVSPVSDMMMDLNRTLLEDVITQVLEANGINLKEGDFVSLLLDEKGNLSIDADKSRISGMSGDEIDEIDDLLLNAIRFLTDALNSAETPNGKPLGSALFEQFAAEKVGMANDDKKGSISFSFGYNAEIDRNEISKVRSSPLETKETKTYLFVDFWTFSEAQNQVLEEYGLLHRSRTFAYSIDIENKKVSFDRDRCLINGLNDEELNEILSKIESKLESKSLVRTFESSKPVRSEWGHPYVIELDGSEKDRPIIDNSIAHDGTYRTTTYSLGGPDYELYSEDELLSYDWNTHRKNYIRQLVEKGVWTESSAQHSMKNMADSEAMNAALPARSAGPPPWKVMEKTTVLFSESVAGKW